MVVGIYTVPMAVYVNASTLGSDKEFSLGAGQYLLALQGTGSSTDYGLRISTPDLISTELTLGETINGSLLEKGERDTYTFTGVAGQQLFFDSLNSAGLNVELYDLNGRRTANWSSSFDRGPNSLTLATDGDYRLVIDGQGDDIGNYQFRLLDKADAPEVLPDTTISGTFVDGVGADLYRLTLTDRQRLNFSSQSSASNQWTLYSPLGHTITNQNFNSDREVWLNPGEHLLALRGRGAANSDYELGIQHLETGTLPVNTATEIALNTVVSGTISTSGDTQSYTFAATAGQQLFYDALSSTRFELTIDDAEGEQRFTSYHSNRDHGPTNGLVLPSDGDYTLTIGEAGTGEFAFRLLEAAAAQVIDLDTDITGTFDNNGLGSDLYQFTLTQDQYVFLDHPTVAGNWSLYRANGQEVDSGSLNYSTRREEFLLGAGDYLLAMQGTGSTDPYQFNLVTPDFVSTPITVGESIAGTLSERGEQDTFTFTGFSGQQLFFDALGGSDFSLELIDPSGRALINSSSTDTRSDRGPSERLFLEVDGEYQLIIDGENGRTGDYAFRLLDQTLATEIALDTDIAGTFDAGTFDDDALGATLYTFNLDQSQYLFFDGLQGNGLWTLYRANGQQVQNGAFSSDWEFSLGAGDYLLAARGRGLDADYTFNLVTPDLVATPMVLGETINGTIDEKGEQDSYTFTGTAGQQLLFDALGGSRFQLSVTDPNGKVLVNSNSTDSRVDRGPDQGLVLSTDGTYRLTIDGYREARGDYRFRVLDRSAATTVDLDTDILGTFDTQGTTLYQFNLDQRQYVYFDALQGTGNWTLYAANGQKVNSSSLTFDQEFWLEGGDYLLAMQGTSSAGDYGLRVITPELTTTSLALGTPIFDNISEKGEQDTYTFEGQAGQKLFFDALGGSPFRVQVLDDTGRELYNASTSDSRNNRGPDQGLTLSKDGNYELIIDGAGGNTGNYGFRLLDDRSAPVLPFDTDITGVLGHNGLESAAYQFQATQGQRFYLDTGFGQGDSNWVLYGPGGQELSSGSLVDGTTDEYEFAAPGTGDYLLVVEGQGDTDLDYHLHLATSQYDQFSLLPGERVTGAIQNWGDRDLYSFEGTAGQSFFFDGFSSDAALTAQLYAPDRSVLHTWPLHSDWASFQLSQTGTYELVIDGAARTTGTYHFGFQDRDQSTRLPFDTSIAGSLCCRPASRSIPGSQGTRDSYSPLNSILRVRVQRNGHSIAPVVRSSRL